MPPGTIGRPIGGTNEVSCREISELVPFEGNTSNTLFEVLEEREQHLKDFDLDVHISKSGPIRARSTQGSSL